jgi:acyl-coenzyme A synthetase/AMP-(fatty) acid ligase
MKIYQSIYPPPQLPTNLSLSQFVCKYNPDAVAGERVILEDDWTGKSVTYQGLRDKAAEHAWSLRAKYRLRQDDVIAISGPNSVRVYFQHNLAVNERNTDIVLRLLG